MLYIIFFLLFALALHTFQKDYQNKWLMVAGIFAGLANLTHASLMMYLPLVVLWVIIITPGSIILKIWRALLFVLMILMIIMPWSIWVSNSRNAVVPVADYGFMGLYHGNHPDYYEALNDYLFGPGYSWLQTKNMGDGMSDSQRLQEVWMFIKNSPLKWLHLYFLKFYYHVQFFNLKDISSLKVAIWSTGYWLLAWSLSIFYIIKQKKAWQIIFLWLVLANLFIYPLIHISRYHRYRIPIEPLIVLLAAGGFSLVLPHITNYVSDLWGRIGFSSNRR